MKPEEKTEKDKHKEKDKDKKENKDKKEKTDKDKDKAKAKESISPDKAHGSHQGHSASHQPVMHQPPKLSAAPPKQDPSPGHLSPPPPKESVVHPASQPPSPQHADPKPGRHSASAEDSHAHSTPHPADPPHPDPNVESSQAHSTAIPPDPDPAHPTPSADSTPTHTSSPSPPSPSDSPQAEQDGVPPFQPAHGSDSRAAQESQPSDRHETPSAATAAPAAAAPAAEAPSATEAEAFAAPPEAVAAAAPRCKTLLKIIARSNYLSSWLIWIPVIMISTPQPSVREQLVNLYRSIVWTGMIVVALRLICKRQRPARSGGKPVDPFTPVLDRYSFPSAGSALAMLACCFLATNYQLDGVVVATAVIVVLLVAISDINLGRHFLIDVLVGWVIGLAMFHVARHTWVPAEQCERYVRRVHEALHL